jgi:hypothetical protein
MLSALPVGSVQGCSLRDLVERYTAWLGAQVLAADTLDARLANTVLRGLDLLRQIDRDEGVDESSDELVETLRARHLSLVQPDRGAVSNDREDV